MRGKNVISNGTLLKLVAFMAVVLVAVTALTISTRAAQAKVTTTPINEKIQIKQLAPYYVQPDSTLKPKGIIPAGAVFDACGITSNNFYAVKVGRYYYYIPCGFCTSLTNTTSQTTQTNQTATHGKVYEATDNSFKSEVLDYNGFVLVDFYAEWCGPCMNMKPYIENIAKNYPEIKIVEVNVDYNDNLCYQYGISSIPALYFFKNGQLEYNTVGGRSEKELLKLIDKYK